MLLAISCYTCIGGPIDMGLVSKHVIPRICAKWEQVCEHLQYSTAIKNMIGRTNGGLPSECCTALLKDWITTDNGVKPKTYEKFIEVLSQISSLAMVTKQIKQCLYQEGILGGDHITIIYKQIP